MQYISTYTSPLGLITIASNGRAIIGLWFEGQKYDCATLTAPVCSDNDAVILKAKQWLDMYFQGKKPDFTPPLEIEGSDFKKMVTSIMLSIPWGHTMTYKEIACQIAQRTKRPTISAQAVGGAVGHNAISIIIPCHRVVGSNGSLTGYAGGVEKKIQLLKLEGAMKETFFTPSSATH